MLLQGYRDTSRCYFSCLAAQAAVLMLSRLAGHRGGRAGSGVSGPLRIPAAPDWEVCCGRGRAQGGTAQADAPAAAAALSCRAGRVCGEPPLHTATFHSYSAKLWEPGKAPDSSFCTGGRALVQLALCSQTGSCVYDLQNPNDAEERLHASVRLLEFAVSKTDFVALKGTSCLASQQSVASCQFQRFINMQLFAERVSALQRQQELGACEGGATLETKDLKGTSVPRAPQEPSLILPHALCRTARWHPASPAHPRCAAPPRKGLRTAASLRAGKLQRSQRLSQRTPGTFLSQGHHRSQSRQRRRQRQAVTKERQPNSRA